MATHYFYLDESGSLDFKSVPGDVYFAIGTAHTVGDHEVSLWEGHKLLVQLEGLGIQVPKGIHAYKDAHPTRIAAFSLIATQPWRFDSTFLRKDAANTSIRERGKARLYKTAVWLHVKYLVNNLTKPGDEVVLIVGSLTLSEQKSAIRNAIEDIRDQLNNDRKITLCIWDASTSWGIQVSDYALWRVQREIEGRKLPSYATAIDHLLFPPFFPWGK